MQQNGVQQNGKNKAKPFDMCRIKNPHDPCITDPGLPGSLGSLGPWQGGASRNLRGAEDPRAQETGWVFVRFDEISWELVSKCGETTWLSG